MTEFSAYLRQLAKGFKSKKDLAKAIGVVAPRLSRAIKGEDPYSFNVENCLRLAKVASRPPREVLEAAGKAKIADLLEFLYPRAGKQTMTAEQRDLLDDWDLLDAERRDAFRVLIRESGAGGKRRRA